MSQEFSEDLVHLDSQLVLELKQLLGDDFPDLVETFLKDSALRIEELELTIESTVAEDVRYAAHSFKGSSLNLGALRLSELCRHLEDMALQGRLYRSNECLERIKVEYSQVADELQAYL